MTRLLYFVSHPIQYQAPLLRRIAQEPEIDLRVVFGETSSAGVHYEPDFGRDVGWDVPMLDGYNWISLSATSLEGELARANAMWVHGWQYSWQRRAIAMAARRSVPVLMRSENWDGAMPDVAGPLGWARRAWRRTLLRRCRAFLAIGSRNRDYYLRYAVPPAQIFPMPYAIDNRVFAEGATVAAPRRAELRHKLGVAPESKVLLFVGKLIPRKRPDLLVEAWLSANWEGQRPTLIFVGDGEMRKSLQRMANDAIFTEFRNQSALPALYDLADLLVVPSEREPWGLVVNEAMACGTAVVASDQVGAAHDLIGPDCGAVFRTGDRDDLAAKLTTCLPNAVRLGERARHRIAGWDFEADVRGLRAALASVQR